MSLDVAGCDSPRIVGWIPPHGFHSSKESVHEPIVENLVAVADRTPDPVRTTVARH